MGNEADRDNPFEVPDSGRRRRWLIVLAGLLLAGLVSCTSLGRPLYSPGEIEDILEERYGLPFSVGDPSERGMTRRTYQVSSPRYPELLFQVEDGWTGFSWSPGLGGVPPTPRFSRHYLRDNCRAAAWNRYAVPLLEAHGLAGLAVPQDQDRLYAGDPSLPRYLIPCAGDMAAHAGVLCGLLEELADLPVFRDAPEPGGGFGIPAEVSAAPGSPLSAGEILWLPVGEVWEEAALLERLEEARTAAVKRLAGCLRRAGILPSLLEGTDLPIPGEDFIVTGELTVRGRAAMFSLDESWQDLLPFLREVSGNEYLNTGTALRCYGTYELAGSSFLCLVTSPTVTTRHQDQSLVMDHVLLAETGTGRLYQYGYEKDRYAVLVRSPHLLPPEALEQLLALQPAPQPS